MAKVIIEAAINGAAPRKLNPNIPYSPAEIAADAVATARAGAAIIHFHVRDPESGKWVHDVPYYAEVYRRARAESDALLWPTFPLDGDAAARFSHFVALAKDPATKPDLGAGDMGSVNLVAYDRERRAIHNEEMVYRNSYATIRYFLEKSRELGLRPTLQIFDPSFLRAALVFLELGVLSEPLLLKFYLGGPELPFGLPPTLKSLEAYLDMLKGVRANWFAATLGGDNLPLVPLIVSLGGHVRVGLEDYQYAREGGPSNPELAARAAETIRAMGHQVATPAEARAILEA
ncbi:3-keto-5-aminohexanoate cleavage protein [bacterium]|nr:3-keto-5-aminohexanoate cleavage protein [bacterium]